MKTTIRTAWIGALILAFYAWAPAWALFDAKKDLSEKARVSLEEAIQTAQQRIIPGRPVEVKIAKAGGRVLYKVEILDANNKSHSVYIDAENGQVVSVK